MTRLAPILLLLAAMLGSDDPPRTVLTISGEVERPLRLSAADLAALPRQTLRAKDHKGIEATFEGVPLIDVLKKAGARVGDRLRGGAMADYLVVEAADGYRVVFALPELDPAFHDRPPILLADRRDGRPMTDPEGPLRLIVPSEKKHARWVRQVTRLTLRRAPTLPAPEPAGR